MSQPPSPYDRQFSFTGWSIAHPNEPHQGDKVDLELNEIKQSLDETQARLSEIQQDDGFIRATALSAGLQELVDNAATTAAAAVYATNLAQLSNKELARANLQLPQHYSMLDGTNVAGWTELPVDPLAHYWPATGFFPQANQTLTGGQKYQTLGSYASREFRASVVTGSLKDYATWNLNGESPDDVPTITTRIDDICAAIGAAGIPAGGLSWGTQDTAFSGDYTQAENLPNVMNPLATILNIRDAISSHSNSNTYSNPFWAGYHISSYSFDGTELTLVIDGQSFVIQATLVS